MGPAGNGSLKMVCPFVNVAATPPLFATVKVHVNGEPAATLPLTLLVFVTVKSGANQLTVLLSLFEITLLTVAEVWFITDPAVISAAITV